MRSGWSATMLRRRTLCAAEPSDTAAIPAASSLSTSFAASSMRTPCTTYKERKRVWDKKSEFDFDSIRLLLTTDSITMTMTTRHTIEKNGGKGNWIVANCSEINFKLPAKLSTDWDITNVNDFWGISVIRFRFHFVSFRCVSVLFSNLLFISKLLLIIFLLFFRFAFLCSIHPSLWPHCVAHCAICANYCA